VIYRLYSSPDFDELYAIEELCFRPHERFGRRYMRQLVESANSATWIAEHDGKMAGFAVADWSEDAGEVVAYIQTIEVLPAERGQGIGGALLKRIEASAQAANACLIWLHVEDANAGAVRLYEAHGYLCEGREEEYYGAGRAALIYAKRLESETTE
jgi:ribosomal protein S18 acetylase RimI-like enzyme